MIRDPFYFIVCLTFTFFVTWLLGYLAGSGGEVQSTTFWVALVACTWTAAYSAYLALRKPTTERIVIRPTNPRPPPKTVVDVEMFDETNTLH